MILLSAKVKERTVVFEFDSPLFDIPLENQLDVTLFDSISGKVIAQGIGPDRLILTKSEKGFNISLPVGLKVVEATLFLKNKTSFSPVISSDLKRQFKKYPITVERVQGNDGLETTKQVMSSIVSVLAGLSSLVLMATSAPAASMIFKMVSSFVFLSLLNSPYLVYPALIFESVIEVNILPFKMPNIFEKWVSSYQCTPHEAVERRKFECSILINAGEDILSFCIVLFLNAIVSILVYKLLKKRIGESKSLNKVGSQQTEFQGPKNAVKENQKEQGGQENPGAIESEKLGGQNSEDKERSIDAPPEESEQNWKEKWAVGLRETFGVKYSLVSLEGLRLELFCIVMIHLYCLKSDLPMIFGMFVCFLILVYFLVKEILQFVLSNQIWALTELLTKTQSDSSPPQNKPKLLEDSLPLKQMKFGILSFNLDGFKIPQFKLQIQPTLLCSIREILLAVFAIGLSDSPSTQHILCLLLEVVYLALLKKTSPKSKKIENIYDLSVPFFNIVYIILMIFCLVFDGSQKSERQSDIGIMAALILLLIMLKDIMFMIYLCWVSISEMLGSDQSKKKQDEGKQKVAGDSPAEAGSGDPAREREKENIELVNDSALAPIVKAGKGTTKEIGSYNEWDSDIMMVSPKKLNRARVGSIEEKAKEPQKNQGRQRPQPKKDILSIIYGGSQHIVQKRGNE